MKDENLKYRINLDIEKELELKRLSPDDICNIIFEEVRKVKKEYNNLYFNTFKHKIKSIFSNQPEEINIRERIYLYLNKPAIEEMEISYIKVNIKVFLLKTSFIFLLFLCSFYFEPDIINALSPISGEVGIFLTVLIQTIFVTIVFMPLKNQIDKYKAKIHWKILRKYYFETKKTVPDMFIKDGTEINPI